MWISSRTNNSPSSCNLKSLPSRKDKSYRDVIRNMFHKCFKQAELCMPTSLNKLNFHGK